MTGIYWDRSLDANNIPARRRYRGRFTIDAERGIVQFAEPVFQINSGGTSFGEAQLYLTIGHGVKDLATLQEVRRTLARTLPGEPNGTGSRVVRREDLVRTVITQYDSGNNPIGVTDNVAAIDAEAVDALDAVQVEFETLETDVTEYAGIVPISPDGAIQQVEWSGGLSGCVTRASRNSEFSVTVPPWHERRHAERSSDQPRINPAMAAPIRRIRQYQGGR